MSVEFKAAIPRSTLASWKNQDLSKIIGADLLPNDDVLIKRFAKNIKMKKAAKALFILSDTITTLFQHAENKATLIRFNKNLILKTIRNVQPVLGTKRVLR